MPEDTFRLPGSSYEELCKIVKAYGYSGKRTTLEELSQLTGQHTIQISRNNAFLTSVGIVESDNRAKVTTELGKNLAHALEYDISDDIAAAWREIVQTNDFLSKMLTALRIRKGMDFESFQAHIAYSAGEKKTNQAMTGARTIIDILRNASLVEERDGQLVIAEKQELTSNNGDQTIHPNNQDSGMTSSVMGSNGMIITQPSVMSPAGPISLHIEIRIDAKPSELDGLGTKLRQLLHEISEDVSSESDFPLESIPSSE